MTFLSNLSLFFLAIAKCGCMSGLLPGGIFLAFFGPRAAKFFCPLSIGKEYCVLGYHTGDFVGEVEGIDRTFARVRVTDPMRPRPRVKDRCSFPECVRKDFHDGDHEFVRVREGALIEVSWESAKWIPIEPSSGGGQLVRLSGRSDFDADSRESAGRAAHQQNGGRGGTHPTGTQFGDELRRPGSPPRKERRSA